MTTDNAHAAQRIRTALAGRGTIATADLFAVLDEHAALLAGQPKPEPFHLAADVLLLGEADLAKVSISLGDSRVRPRRRPLSARLDRIADALYVSASKIEITLAPTYKALTDQIIALRVEADQARAAETTAAKG